MAFSNLKESKPKEPYPYSSYADNRAGEEEKNQEEENDVVNRKDLGGHDKYPINGVKDVDVAQDVSAMAFAD